MSLSEEEHKETTRGNLLRIAGELEATKIVLAVQSHCSERIRSNLPSVYFDPGQGPPSPWSDSTPVAVKIVSGTVPT